MRSTHIVVTALVLAGLVTGCSQRDRMMGPSSETTGDGDGDATGALEIDKSRAAGETAGVPMYVLAASGQLLVVEASDPSRVRSRARITGLSGARTRLLGIDVRPATGALYGLGSDSRLYTIDPATGVAQAVGDAAFATALAGTAFGFDFNPTVDRIRIVSDQGQNLRAHPVTGAIVAVDGAIAYNATDANAGRTPRVTAVAYTNPDNDLATGTTLYDVDAALDILTTQAPPNDGTLNTTDALGFDAGQLAGFDIALENGQNIAYLAVKSDDDGALEEDSDVPATLMRLDLATGAATEIGKIRGIGRVIGLAIGIAP